MTRQSSYYDLFGVSRSATANEIRAAYVALMKKYHPDAAGAGDAVADQRVALLNRCYSVLKDPLKRAEYDAKLALKSREIHAVSRSQEQKVVQSPGPLHSRWAVLLLVFAAAAAVIAAQFGNQWQTDIGSSAASLFGWSPMDQPTAVMRPVPSSEVDRALRLATAVSADQAAITADRLELKTIQVTGKTNMASDIAANKLQIATDTTNLKNAIQKLASDRRAGL